MKDFNDIMNGLEEEVKSAAVLKAEAEATRLKERNERVAANEKAAEVKRQGRKAILGSMVGIVRTAHAAIALNGGGPKEEALILALMEYRKPTVQPKKEA